MKIGEYCNYLSLKSLTSRGELRVFFEIPESEICPKESLEKHIGLTILAFLSATYATTSFRLGQYKQAAENFDQTISDVTNTLPDSTDADDIFDGAMLRINRFDETWLLEDIDDMTALLEQSAKMGSKKAVQFLLDDWPTQTKIFKKRLGRIADKKLPKQEE